LAGTRLIEQQVLEYHAEIKFLDLGIQKEHINVKPNKIMIIN
jgi:hypothetical protein